MREKGHEVREMNTRWETSMSWEMSWGKKEKGGQLRSEGRKPGAYP